MGKGRLEAFSDGVLAVAITLLAFNLHAGVRSKVPLATQIREQWPSFAAYVLSFFIIGVVWLNHHYLLSLTTIVDRRLMLYNLLLLLFVAAIPYATATYADYVLRSDADAHTAVLVYTFIMEGMAISRFLLCYHIFSSGLNPSPVPEQEARRLFLRYGLATVVFPVIAIVAITIDVRLVLVLNGLLLMYYLGPGLRPIEIDPKT
ncbi:MAG: TMEM175 family protein [Mycobacteriaceae bacterium]